MNETVSTASMSPAAFTRVEIDALADRIAERHAQELVLRHGRLTDIRRFDEVRGWAVQGAESCAHWLAWRLGVDIKTAHEQVRVARALGVSPRIDEAFGRGALSYSKVRAITRVATPKTEARLVDLALRATAPQLDKICRGYRRVAPGSSDEEFAGPGEKRFFERRDLPSGLVRFTIDVRPEEAAIVEAALDETRKRMVSAHGPGDQTDEESSAEECTESSAEDHAESSAEDDTESSPGRSAESSSDAAARRVARVDAFVALCEACLAYPPPGSVGSRHEVVLHVDARTGTGELPDGTCVGPETVRRLCCDSPIVTLVERAVAKGAPRVVEVGRMARGTSPRLRRLLEEHDPSCRFPGCLNRYWVDAHHIEHWADGGETKLENLVLTCRRHHRLVHEGGFSVEQTPDGPIFYDPRGRRIDRVPAPADPGPEPLATLDAARLLEGIDAWTNTPGLDGTPLSIQGAVNRVLREGHPELSLNQAADSAT